MTAYEETGMSAQAWRDEARTAWPRTGATPEREHRQRTPLSVVPTPLPRSGSGVAVLCGLVLLVALGLVLVMNITMSNRQFTLLDLRAQQTTLSETNERLAEQAGYLDAPQNLAARAGAMGMVSPGATSTVDVASGAVAGPSTGAGSTTLPEGRIAPPADADLARQGEAQGQIPGPRTVDPAAPAAAPSGETAPTPAPTDAPAGR